MPEIVPPTAAVIRTPGTTVFPLRILYYNPGVDRVEAITMQPEIESKGELNPEQAAEHLAHVHVLLKALQDKIGEHPLLAEAILKVEMALNILGVKTGGML